MVYATIEGDDLYFRFCKDYNSLSEKEETLGLVELASTEDYIIYKTDLSCLSEHLVLIGNNEEKSLSLKAQYQLNRDFDNVFYEEIE